MATVYDVARKHRYRVTLDLNVLGDFDPQNINWEKLFELQSGEKCDAYIEDLDSDIW